MSKLFFTAFSFLPFLLFSQLKGVVLDKSSNSPLVGVKLISSDGNKTLSDFEGKFELGCKKFPVTIVASILQYATDTIIIDNPGAITIKLAELEKELEMVVVSAGRRKQAIEDVPISMEIIKPQLIDNKGITDLEQAVDQTPGVFTMDGQVSIRGGSGFAYGAGSRVLLLWNGMPLLSGYAGDTQWNAIPMEQASQIEVMKGASSVLYGSGALNGVIALTEKEPSIKPETKVKVMSGFYGNPKRESLKWWTKNPMFQQIEAYRGQMFKKTGYTISTTLFHNDGFRQGEMEYRGRVSGTIYFLPQKINRLKAGIGYNFQLQKTGNFLIWQSDSLGYVPSGGADTSKAESTLTYNLGQRLFIDPYLKYIDKNNNKHSLKTRLYYAYNGNINNPSQSNGAIVYFTDYQFQRQFGTAITLTSGISNIYNVVTSNLFGNHTSNNAAIYTQYEHHVGKLDITAGLRLEHFQMDEKLGDSKFMFNKKDSISMPFYPILRTGFHYELARFTHLRASIGQGIRYPSVAERYTKTSVGALNIFPNSALRPEIGWSGEVGFKQGIKIGDWKGMFDVAGFLNYYSNMIEFTFGVYDPINGNNLNTQTSEGLNEYLALINAGYTVNDFIGFRATNAEKARITGIEFSFNSLGKIGEVELISLIGYTYMNPVSLNKDETYKMFNSDSTSSMLKYRFNHLAKADIEINWKNLSFGLSSRYNSFMKNIDKVFEDPIVGETYILPGLKKYRQNNRKGNLVFDFRVGYKLNDNFRIGLIANNVFNEEYMTRPGDIQPPRNFMLQLQMKF
jgi:outer membrane receptor protein involved in Fe transport